MFASSCTLTWSGWEIHTSTHILQHFVDALMMFSAFKWKIKNSLNKNISSFTRLEGLDNECMEGNDVLGSWGSD